ncbi:MAG: TonB-dependent receptor, partial [Candidatus Sulfotelmatobacter sp.]
PPPWTQNQYGFQVGGPVIKDKTFFYVSWEQYRQRTGSPFTTSIPAAGMTTGNFSALCPGGFNGAGVCNDPAGQIYDPFSTDAAGNRKPYAGDIIPASEFSTAGSKLLAQYYPAPNLPGTVNNYLSAAPAGGNTNEFVARGDQNIGSNTHVFGRFAYYGLTDLPVNPLGTGLCLDRCAEKYHSKLLAIGINHVFTSNTILDVNLAGSRFVYGRTPLLSGFDLTTLGWPSTYNTPADSMRTPPTPETNLPNDVGHTQGNSAIGDHNTQYNVSPQLTMIRGKHNIQIGGQYELGLDNYFQTNIASGAFGFDGTWTNSNPTSATPTGGFAFADFLLGLGLNQGTFAGNQSEGIAQVPAQTKGKETYRALYIEDTWHVTSKFTASLGLRYELPGTWSEAYNRLSYWDPFTNNATVTGCNGTAGSVCPGDAMYVGNGPNSTDNNLPLNKKAFSPRVGMVYSPDQKTVVRAGYGVFFIPNYVSFALNPDNDVINLAATDFTATTNGYITPASSLDGASCGFTNMGFAATSPVFAPRGNDGFVCNQSGPFGNTGILPPPGRNAAPTLSSFVAANGSPGLAPYFGYGGEGPKYGYVEQWNLDIQRQLPAGFFADVAYAGSHGVHLQQYQTNVNQIPDSFVTQAAAQYAANPAVTPTIGTLVTNVLTSPNTALNKTDTPMIHAGQYDRPYPEYNGLNLNGYGCCGSSYNSLQATVTRRFQGGGTMLVAYTNAKLMSNTDTLTSWLEGNTGGVGSVQDWNNLAGERSLSSQDVSQRLVISYVLDLPFGHGKAFASGLTGLANGAVSGWGVDGITTFQRGFPLKISYTGTTPLEGAGLGVANVRPDVVAGCDEKAGGGHITNWFNTTCFSTPPAWGFGNESRVDPVLRGPGINNFDFAIFKRTKVSERLGIEFRTEFFNLFNHPYFNVPATGFNGVATGPNSSGFGTITSTVQSGVASPERLIQFALKVVF